MHWAELLLNEFTCKSISYGKLLMLTMVSLLHVIDAALSLPTLTSHNWLHYVTAAYIIVH